MWADLEDTLEALRSGQGGVRTLRGASGMGKSRLLEEAAAWAAVPAAPAGVRAEVLWLRAEPYGVNSAYGVFRDPLRALLEVGGRDRADAVPSLAERVAVLDPSLVPLLPLLGDVMHLDVPPTPESEAIDPRFRPDVVAEVVGTVLGATISGPLLILVDDAQWADAASAHLLERLAAATERRPWLLLVARRDTDGGFSADDWPAVALPPLDERALRARSSPTPPRRPRCDLTRSTPSSPAPTATRCSWRSWPAPRTTSTPRTRCPIRSRVRWPHRSTPSTPRPAGSCATRRSSAAPSASTPSSRC